MSVKTEQVRVEFAGEFNRTLKLAFDTLKKQVAILKRDVAALQTQLNASNKKLGQNAAAMQKAAKSSKGYGKEVKHVGDEFQRYNTLLSKFNADTQAGLAAAKPYFKALAKGSKEGGEGLEYANRKTTNLTHGLKQMRQTLIEADKALGKNRTTWRNFGENTRAASIRQGELAGALKITSQGIKMLNPDAQKYLRLTNEQSQALHRAEGRTQGYVTAMNQAWKQVRGNVGQYQAYVTQLDKADKAIARTANALNKAKKNGTAYYETANRLVVAKNLLNKSLTQTNGVLTPVAQRLGLVSKEAGMLRSAIMGVVDSFKSMARYAAGAMIFYQLFNLFRTGTQSMIDFSQGMKDLQAIINETDENIENLGETVKEVAANTKYSTTEVAEGMKLLGQAGLSAAEIMQSIESVAQLATGTMTDFKTTSDLMTTTIRAFQMNFLETGRVADVFANAINRSKLTVEKLRVSFNYLAPLARAANITFEETTAALMMLANAGIRASTMGTGMRQVLIRLVNPTAEFASAIEAAGYSVREFNPLHNDLADIFDRLSDVVPTAAEAIRFFHVRSLPSVMVFASQSGEALRNFMREVEEVGAALRMMETQTEGLGIKFKQVADRFSVLSVAIGQSGIDVALHLIADSLRGMLAFLTKVAEQGFTPVLLAMAATAVGLKTLVGAFSLLMGTKVYTALLGWTAGFTAFAGQLKATTVAVYGTQGAVAALTAGLKLLFTTMLNNPIIAFTALIVGVYTAYNRWMNRNEVLIKSLNRKIEKLQTTQEQIELYTQKIAEAVDEGKPFIHFLERAIHEIPELRGQFVGIAQDADKVIEKLGEIGKNQSDEVLSNMARKAAVAGAELNKFRKIIEQTDQDFIKWYERAGRPGVGTHPMVKAFEEAEQGMEKSQLAIRDYVNHLIVDQRKLGVSWEDMSNVIIYHYLEQGKAARKNLKDITEISNSIIELLRLQDEEAEKAARRLPRHLEELVRQNEAVRDEVVESYRKYVDDLTKLDTGDHDEDFISDAGLERTRELNEDLSAILGTSVNLNAMFNRVLQTLQNFGGEGKKFRESLSIGDRVQFDDDVVAVLEGIDEIAQKLREAGELSTLEIKAFVDEETFKRVEEVLEEWKQGDKSEGKTAEEIARDQLSKMRALSQHRIAQKKALIALESSEEEKATLEYQAKLLDLERQLQSDLHEIRFGDLAGFVGEAEIQRLHNKRLQIAKKGHEEELELIRKQEKEKTQAFYDELVERHEQEKEANQQDRLDILSNEKNVIQVRKQNAEMLEHRKEFLQLEIQELDNHLDQEKTMHDNNSEYIIALEEYTNLKKKEIKEKYIQDEAERQRRYITLVAESTGNNLQIVKAEIEVQKQELQELAEEWKKLGLTQEEVTALMTERLKDLNQELEKQESIVSGSYWRSFRTGIEHASTATKGFGELWYEIGTEMPEKIADGFVDMWGSFIDGSKSAKEAMADFAASTLKWIAEIIMKQMILNSISGFFGGGGGVGPGKGFSFGSGHGAMVGSYHKGGIAGKDGLVSTSEFLSRLPKFHQGLRSDEVLSILQKGERVVSKPDVSEEKQYLQAIFEKVSQGQQQGTRIVNVLDPNIVEDWATSSQGEKVLINTITRNAAQLRKVL